MFIYIKAPLANRSVTECLSEKPKADGNEMEITADTSQAPMCRSAGCVGAKAVKIHLQRKLQGSSSPSISFFIK